MPAGKKLIAYPTKFKVGSQTITPSPLSSNEKKERIAFTRAIMQTPQYKQLLRKGNSKIEAISKASQNIQTNTQGKWFSVKRLPPKLQKVAKKYWVK